MKGKVTREQWAEVRWLLANTKESDREIAQVTGVSRGTVQNLRHNPNKPEPRFYDDASRQAGQPHRCEGCGGMIYTRDCVLCIVREHQSATA